MKYSAAFVYYAKRLAEDRYQPLTLEKERELLHQCSEGREDAFNKIVNAYLRFVIFLLREFKIPDDVDIMDIIQEGNLGLMHGLTKFNPELYDCRVSTYCAHWIRFFINKSLSIYSKSRNFFTPILDEEYLQGYVIEKDSYKDKANVDIVDYALSKLNERERLVVSLYFGLQSPYISKTLLEIASMLHINFERVRQLKDLALEKMKPYVDNPPIINQIRKEHCDYYGE